MNYRNKQNNDKQDKKWVALMSAFNPTEGVIKTLLNNHKLSEFNELLVGTQFSGTNRTYMLLPVSDLLLGNFLMDTMYGGASLYIRITKYSDTQVKFSDLGSRTTGMSWSNIGIFIYGR